MGDFYEYTTRSVGSLIPYASNSRIHSEKQVNEIIASIKEWGFTNPILIDESDGVIAGHGRILAANKMGLKEVPCIIMSGLTEGQKKAYVIADNQLALNAGWDEELLAAELRSLKELDFNLDLLAFDENFLDELLSTDEYDHDAADEIPPEPTAIITYPGDVWLLGNHRLMCGSSTVAKDVEKLLAGEQPNTMLTDPPYGIKYEAGARAEAKGSKKTARENTSSLMNDDKDDWYEAYKLFPGTVAYVWHAAMHAHVVQDGLKRAGFELKQQIIWNKNVHILSRSDYHWKHEPCWYAVRDNKNRNWKGGRTQKTVWDVPAVIYEDDKTPHPTQKPVELYVRPLECHTSPGEYVYEPFGGSGSGLIACEVTDRRCLCMELDPKFVDVIITRWQRLTEKQATLQASGKNYEDVSKERLAKNK